MEKELKRKIMRKIIIRIIVMFSAAALIIVSFVVFKSMMLNDAEKALDETYANKYSVETKYLDFLNKDQKKIYENKVIKACEAYDLVNISKIVTDRSSVIDNKEAGVFEWIIYADDTKNTSFTCDFKKSTKNISVEKNYNAEFNSAAIIERNKVNTEKENGENESSGKSFTIKKGTAVPACTIKDINITDDCKILQSDKKRQEFVKSLCKYFASIGISEVSKISFDSFNEYDGKKYDNELIFDLEGIVGGSYSKLSGVYKDGKWTFAIIY